MPTVVLKQLFPSLAQNSSIRRQIHSLICINHRNLWSNNQKIISNCGSVERLTHLNQKQLLRRRLNSITSSMSRDRGIADGAEQLANDQSLASGIASVQVGVGTTPDKTKEVAAQQMKQWSPDSQLMTQLTSMGIRAVTAKKALFYSDNQSVESAINWIFENPDNDLDTPLELELNVNDLNTSAVDIHRPPDNSRNEVYKMVFIVNSSLEMGVGKIAAQVAHAALGMHQILLQDESKFGESLIRWFEFGETKIVLKGESTQHLIELEKRALELGLPTYLVQDAGKTQVKAGSTTVLCLYGQTDCVDMVSGRLRLL